MNDNTTTPPPPGAAGDPPPTRDRDPWRSIAEEADREIDAWMRRRRRPERPLATVEGE